MFKLTSYSLYMSHSSQDMEKDGDSVDEAKPNSHHPPDRPEKPQHLPPKDNKLVSAGLFLCFFLSC